MNIDIHLLSGAYAVDALDPQERADFEAHLATCASCQAEVASFREAGSSLAALSTTTPPPELRDRVLSSIATVRPLPPEIEPDSTVPAAPAATVTPLRPRRWWAGTSLLVAAAAVLVLGLVWHPWVDDKPRDLVAAVLTAPDAQRFDQLLPDGGKVSLYRSVSLDRSAAVASNLPALPDGKVYELWYQDPTGTMVPAGLMPDEPDGRLALKGSAAEATAAGITVEPAGGSDKPTSNPIALFGFAKS
ncbi:anti-sigma factor domain-containing protein [Nocardioides sp. Kera G14]|uniref:anti-sigma factor n=1 Tax=Nocardioides sp. Kera G14 TaxID=2884264 RepID=UPI001D10AC87|nr:anti-sigma factor [Nocardioides sp. Kera G14]UDY24025.1 anti-sigma factor [Nocardioides sp. Kera G14]